MRYFLFALLLLATSASAQNGSGWGAVFQKGYVDPGAIRDAQEAAADALHAKEMEDGRRGWVERTYHCNEEAGTCPQPGETTINVTMKRERKVKR